MTVEVLLTGGSGQVGQAVQRLAPPGWTIVAPSSADLNITDPQAVSALLESRSWGLVINSAAYTAVDKAQSEIVQAWLANALGPAAIAQAAARHSVPVIQLSTDYVFDGAKTSPYVEDDPVRPLGVYGASKLAGEQAVGTSGARHVILRTAWVISPDGANFAKTMLRLGAERPVLRVVDDQRGCPTSAADIASALAVVGERLIQDADAPTGVYHFVNSGEASWRELAEAIFATAKARRGSAPSVEAITTADYPTPARRPMNSRLSTQKLSRDFGIQPPAWRQAVDEVVQAILEREGAKV